MTLSKHRRRGNIGLLGFLDRETHGSFGHDVAKPPVAIDHRRGRRLLDDRPRRARHDVADLNAVDIGRDLDDPVRVVTGQVGVDAVAHHDLGLFGRCAGGNQQLRADALQLFCCYSGHDEFCNALP